MSAPRPSGLPFRLPLGRGKRGQTTEPPFTATSWGGALAIMAALVALLWGIQIANANDGYGLNRFGIRPREVDGLWGLVTEPLLHGSYGHIASNTLPLLVIGWVLLLSGVRVFLFVTTAVVTVGGLLTWLVAPPGIIVGASAMIFGWLGYLLARAYFSRRLKWIATAVALLVFFGTLLGNLLPSVDARISWQSHLCGFAVGVGVGWLLHPRRGTQPRRSRRISPHVS